MHLYINRCNSIRISRIQYLTLRGKAFTFRKAASKQPSYFICNTWFFFSLKQFLTSATEFISLVRDLALMILVRYSWRIPIPILSNVISKIGGRFTTGPCSCSLRLLSVASRNDYCSSGIKSELILIPFKKCKITISYSIWSLWESFQGTKERVRSICKCSWTIHQSLQQKLKEGSIPGIYKLFVDFSVLGDKYEGVMTFSICGGWCVNIKA